MGSDEVEKLARVAFEKSEHCHRKESLGGGYCDFDTETNWGTWQDAWCTALAAQPPYWTPEQREAAGFSDIPESIKMRSFTPQEIVALDRQPTAVDLPMSVETLKRLEEEVENLENMVWQAYQVIGALIMPDTKPSEAEEIRALDYFSNAEYDENFLPWPQPTPTREAE